jgi:Ca-activated chloride channel family protein
MGIFDRHHIERKSEERYGWSLLSELVEMTGGRLFPVSKLTDLPDIASKIGMELRNQYVLGYKPPDTSRVAEDRSKAERAQGTAARQGLRQIRILGCC